MGDCSKYTIGWICAITTEYVAAKAFLDKEHESLEYGSANDNNIYTLGEMGKHNVVITQLPKGEYGIAAAASIARDLVRTFPNIRIGLMVGIGGGAPSEKHDIRLGDVVVSAPHNGKGGLCQYDFGKAIQDQEFQATGFLDQPPGLLRAAISHIEAEYEMEGHQLDEIINSVLEKWPRLRKKYKRPGISGDLLYQSHIVHPSNDERSCEIVCGNDKSRLIVRPDRTDEEDNPAIHYGLIASANRVMKDALVRDRLSAEKDVLCFEMEAAGLMNHFPCVIIRGICDYSDSHKNKDWQGYAAMSAAAYANDLLSHILPNHVEAEKKISDILASVQVDVGETRDTTRVLLSEQRREKVIAKLPLAKGSTFDSSDESVNPTCLPGTRTELQRQIHEWAQDQQGKCIFWLNGMAGTGKSTISRTVAESFTKEGRLGASFFFKRSEADRSHVTLLFTTISAQLLVKIPALTSYIETAINTDPYISSKSMGEQFEKLICQPLSELRRHSQQTSKLVVVIDALDECAQDGDTLLRLLAQTRDKWSPSLQIFITSRPEQQIRFGFADVPEDIREDMMLHEIPEPIIKQDITIFLNYKFTQIREKYMKISQSLPSDWPGFEVMSALVEMAVPIFIFAATICRFVEDPAWSNPMGQLNKILAYRKLTSSTEMHQLDATYSPILNQLIYGQAEKTQELLVERFRTIVGTIAHLAEPLSRSSLASLLHMDIQEIDGQLSSLHSVLSVPCSAGSPIRVLHLSFRDFLVHSETRKTNPFGLDERKIHSEILVKCLQRMAQSGCLKDNICNLEHYGALRTEIDSKSIANSLPPDVQYACRFWVYHLQESQTHIKDNDPVHVFLQDHFLHWLESLSLLGRSTESIDLIRILQNLSIDKDTQIYKFLGDAMRFIQRYSSIIDRAPLQIYSSAIIFSPTTSIIRNFYINKVPSWIQKLPQVESTWNAVLQTLEGHINSVYTVAFSPDGKLMASGSADQTIKLWDLATGSLQQTLKGHSSRINTVTFSPDNKLVVSGSSDRTVKLWDLATGSLKQTFKGYFGSIRAVAFSLDGKLVALGSYNRIVNLWDQASSRHQIFEGHSDLVRAVAFSPNSNLVASGSNDHKVKLWDPATGSLQQTLKGHSGPVHAVTFSPDNKLVASGSADQTIKLWDLATGTPQKTFKGHSKLVCAVAFSPDGKLVASGSDDETVKLWNSATGSLQQSFEGHINIIYAVAFSPDGNLVSSGSRDHTVKLWDPATGIVPQTFEGHSDSVMTVAFSPDGKLVASSSYDHTVKVWDPATGSVQQTFEGHTNLVESVAISPDNKLVASASNDQTIKLWDLATGSLQKTFKNHSSLGHPVSVNAVTFSPDGKLMASCSDDHTAKIWDLATSSLQRTFNHSHIVFTVAFSPDGKLVASGSGDYTVKLWDPATGIIQQIFQGHSHSIFAVAFSPDGKLVASASYDQTIKLWDLATGSLQQTFTGQFSALRAVAFSPDGNYLETNLGRSNIESCSIPSRASNLYNNLLVEREWLGRNDTTAIWLPNEYRVSCSAVYKSMLALGHASGRVTFLKLI